MKARVVEEVPVARDDRVGAGGTGKSDEIIIAGIADHRRRRRRIGLEYRQRSQHREECEGLAVADAVAKVRPG
jgi:hypothetical protein